MVVESAGGAAKTRNASALVVHFWHFDEEEPLLVVWTDAESGTPAGWPGKVKFSV